MAAARVIAERLTLIRKSLGLTRKGVADKTRLSERNITRLENGEISSPRRETINRLARGLNIEPGVLIGDSPIPQDLLRRPGAPEKNQFNVRISAAHRNAYELAARRYGVSALKIAELAPLLFVIVAEESLRYRREKLAEFDNALDKRNELESELSYLPTPFSSANPNDLLEAEERSIDGRDLFGEYLTDMHSWDWIEPCGNPFEVYLKAKARVALEHQVQQQFTAEVRTRLLALKPSATEGEIAATIKNAATQDKGKESLTKLRERHASIRAIGRAATEYEVCRTEALELVEGDSVAAELLISGRVTIDKTFRGMKTSAERIEWIRKHQAVEADEALPDDEAEYVWGSPDFSLLSLPEVDLDQL